MSEGLDDLEELMCEPPGGENHGRTRFGGVWYGLDNGADSALEEHYQYIVHVPIHGTRACYINEGCRCQPCRRANAEYERKRTSGKLPESGIQ